MSCAEFDGQLVRRPQALAALMDQFVCVRLVEANTLDLTLFDFDTEMTFAAFFLNPDRTLYARYGSESDPENPERELTNAGLAKVMERVLAMHRAWPGNKASLSAKQARQPLAATALALPGMTRYRAQLDYAGKTAASCIHCHQINEAVRAHYWQRGERIPDEALYGWVSSLSVGLTFAPAEAARVESVAAESPAAKAGLMPGDDITAIAGAPTASIADVLWHLQTAAPDAKLPVAVQRSGKPHALEIHLPARWRETAVFPRRAGAWSLRGWMLGGLLLESIPPAERAAASIAGDSMALRIKHVGEYGHHAAAKRAGFRKGDILIEAAGTAANLTETQLIARIAGTQRPGDKIKATVLRDGTRHTFEWPVQAAQQD